MSAYQWRPITPVPAQPVSALLAVFDDDGDNEPYLLDGIWIVSKGRWEREDGTLLEPPAGAWWIDEEALFAAWPLHRPDAA
jgi:hypothetical protein